MCSKSLLKDLLSGNNMDLLVLIKLRRYKRAYGPETDMRMSETAVVHIKQTLEIEAMPQDSQSLSSSFEETPQD